MSRKFSHRIVTAAAAAAVLGSGLTAVATTTGAGEASAACRNSTSMTKTLIVDYIMQKSVAAQTAAGGNVVYSLAMSTTSVGNPYVQGVWDIPPTVLKDLKPAVSIKAFTLLGGILGGGGAFGNLIEEKPVNPADVIQDGISWRVRHTGYAVFAGQAFVAEYSYKLPDSIKAGTELKSGGATFLATPNPPLGYVEMSGLTACTTIRSKNAGEAIGGSMEDNGFGSNEGGLSSTGSILDMIPGIIGGLG